MTDQLDGLRKVFLAAITQSGAAALGAAVGGGVGSAILAAAARGAIVGGAVVVTAETTQQYVLKDFEKHEGEVVGTGQCAALCQVLGKVPLTAQWIEGPKVKGNKAIQYGTAIATFVNGKYPNKSHGNHVAIYIEQNATGIRVFDQWTGRPAGYRWIRFKEGDDDPSNDGDAFSVILTRKPASPSAAKK